MHIITIVSDPMDPMERQRLLLEQIRAFRPMKSKTELDVRYAKKGKPCVVYAASGRRVPGVHFSISHSGGLWACVISDSPCGLDLQLMRPAAVEQLMRRFFFPAEGTYVKEAGLRGFYEIWTRREALAKYTGLGFFGMPGARPKLVDDMGWPTERVMWDEKGIVFESLQVPEGFMAVWCHEEENGGKA